MQYKQFCNIVYDLPRYLFYVLINNTGLLLLLCFESPDQGHHNALHGKTFILCFQLCSAWRLFVSDVVKYNKWLKKVKNIFIWLLVRFPQWFYVDMFVMESFHVFTFAKSIPGMYQELDF